MTQLAIVREPATNVARRARCGESILMATVAIHRFACVHVIAVTTRTLQRHMSTGKREAGCVVIVPTSSPFHCGMAGLAIC
jgi:hypothetical protein